MSFVPVQKKDHVEDGLEKLVGAATDQPRIRAWLESYLNRIQDLENAVYRYIFGVLLDNAVGVHLDNLGALVGEPRSGKSDERFRFAIRIAARVNRSSGRVVDLLEIVDLASDVWQYREVGNAKFRVQVQDADMGELARWLRKARLAGVGAELVRSPSSGPGFRFGTTIGTTINPGKWGSTTAPAHGSKLANVRRI
jgi:hypothetical protein